MNDHHELTEAVNRLCSELSALRAIVSLVCHPARPATKHDMDAMEGRLSGKLDKMADDLQSLIDATSALSTAADAQSVKSDKVVEDFEKLLTALAAGGNTLTPAAIAARDTAKKSVAALATAGDKLDAEITKVDGVLPTPAPAAPPVP